MSCLSDGEGEGVGKEGDGGSDLWGGGKSEEA